MSTKIYGGRIAPKLGIQDLLEQFIRCKHLFVGKARKLFYTKMYEQVLADYYFLSKGNVNHLNTFYHLPESEGISMADFWRQHIKKSNNKTSEKFLWFFRAYQEKVNKCLKYCLDNHKKYEYDFTFNLCVYPYAKTIKNKSLMVIFTESDELEKYFDDLPFVQDYHYQNSTDKPDDVSSADWKKRIRDWDRVIGNKNYSHNAYQFELVSLSDLSDFYFNTTTLSALNVKIDRKRVAKNIFLTLETSRKWQIYLKQKKEKNSEYEVRISDYMNIRSEVISKIDKSFTPYIQKINQIYSELKRINLPR